MLEYHIMCIVLLITEHTNMVLCSSILSDTKHIVICETKESTCILWVKRQKGLTIDHINIQIDPFASKLAISKWLAVKSFCLATDDLYMYMYACRSYTRLFSPDCTTHSHAFCSPKDTNELHSFLNDACSVSCNQIFLHLACGQLHCINSVCFLHAYFYM